MLPRIQRKMDHGIVSTIKPLLESWAGIKLSHEGMPQPGEKTLSQRRKDAYACR